MYTRTHTHTCMGVYMCIYTHALTHTLVWWWQGIAGAKVYVYIKSAYTRVRARVCVCVFVYTYAYKHTHSHTHVYGGR